MTKPSQNSEPAKAVRKYLKDKGHDVPHTVILEALARAGGFQNRHQARVEDKAADAKPVDTSQSSIKVHVLQIDHRHGRNTSVHWSQDDAYAELLAYVDDEWENEIGSDREGLEGKDLIDAYFEKLGERSGNAEFYEIEEILVQGKDSTLPEPVKVERPKFAKEGQSPIKVHALEIHYGYGRSVTLHWTQEEAYAKLLSSVEKAWKSEIGDDREGLEGKDLIDAYFKKLSERNGTSSGDPGSDFYDIQEIVIQGKDFALPEPIKVQRPEFADENSSVSIAETLVALVNAASLDGAHKNNLQRIRNCLEGKNGYTARSLAMRMLEEYGIQIIVSLSVDDVEESLEGVLEDDEKKPSRKLIEAAVRRFALKEGISSDATDAIFDSVCRTVMEWQKEDEKSSLRTNSPRP